eukprot:5453897-Prymnesium_polylepis.1
MVPCLAVGDEDCCTCWRFFVRLGTSWTWESSSARLAPRPHVQLVHLTDGHATRLTCSIPKGPALMVVARAGWARAAAVPGGLPHLPHRSPCSVSRRRITSLSVPRWSSRCSCSFMARASRAAPLSVNIASPTSNLFVAPRDRAASAARLPGRMRRTRGGRGATLGETSTR